MIKMHIYVISSWKPYPASFVSIHLSKNILFALVDIAELFYAAAVRDTLKRTWGWWPQSLYCEGEN